jgi:hypothetical protein
MLWDLNRQCFVRELPRDGPVEVRVIPQPHWLSLTKQQCARINDMTGNIMICRGSRITLFSLNGALLVDQVVCETKDDYIVSCAFYEGASNEWLERELLFTGHTRGLVNVRDVYHVESSCSMVSNSIVSTFRSGAKLFGMDDSSWT